MNDREKVIKGLELCDIGSDKMCYERDCPYYQNGCTERLKEDALELLKAQEPLKPFRGNSGWACSACGNLFNYLQEYCDVCGRQVNWDA